MKGFIQCAYIWFLTLNTTVAQAQLQPLEKNADDNTLLWQVSGKGLSKPSYLFGTFHLMCKEDIFFSPQLKKAIAAADTIYMELDMDDPSLMLNGLLMMRMKGGKKISNLLDTAAYNKLSLFFRDSVHIPLKVLESIKPYFLIAMLYPKMMPCATASGVEEELVKMAKQQGKSIKGLETLAQQSAVFDSIPYELQAKELVKAIDSFGRYRQYFETMLHVYRGQQLNRIETIFNDNDFGMEGYQDILLDKRNSNWVEQLKRIMHGSSVFVAVGAGHLPGQAGLIALLQQEGYLLTPLLNK
jgi:uncharacterized protein